MTMAETLSEFGLILAHQALPSERSRGLLYDEYVT
jgi:hypothetical protein